MRIFYPKFSRETVAGEIRNALDALAKERNDAYAVCKKTLGVPRLEPHVYTEREYDEMKGTVDGMTIDGIVLFSGWNTPSPPRLQPHVPVERFHLAV